MDAPTGPGESDIGQGEKPGQIETLALEAVPVKHRRRLTVHALIPTEHSFLEQVRYHRHAPPGNGVCRDAIQATTVLRDRVLGAQSGAR